jgi:ATP-binding cassette subfamily B (MDR/TAP) protein 1
MLESLLRQDIAFFDRPENAAATLASKLSTSPAGLQDLIGMNVALILIVVFNIISNFILALVYGWKLALVIWFGVLPVIFGSGFLRIRLETNFHQKISRPFADSARFASEAVGAMRTVVSFAIEDSITNTYDARLNKSLREAIRFTLHTVIWFGLTESIPFLGMALAFWYGGKLISTGEYSTTQFFVIYVAIIFGGEAAAQFFAWTSSEFSFAFSPRDHCLMLNPRHRTSTRGRQLHS